MARIIINQERCKGCGLCLEVCPRKVLSPAPQVNKKGVHPIQALQPAECSGCKLCVTVCPDVAISLIDDK